MVLLVRVEAEAADGVGVAVVDGVGSAVVVVVWWWWYGGGMVMVMWSWRCCGSGMVVV